MAESSPHAEMVPVPTTGRTFGTTRRVRWGDATTGGRLRLDGTARYLQDLSNDDTRDAGHDPASPWVVRKTTIEVHRPARVGELVTATTFCGGQGQRWAERRTSLSGDRGGRIEAASIWVHVNAETGMPARLPEEFHVTYDEAAGGRSVSARLALPPVSAEAAARPWPLRSTDLDGLGHVNNAATWEAVEDELARLRVRPLVATLEYHHAIEPADSVSLHSDLDGEARRLGIWLVVAGKVKAAAEVALTDG